MKLHHAEAVQCGDAAHPDASRATGAAILLVLIALLPLACGPRPGERSEDVRALVQRAALAWDERDFEAMVACYTGERAGRYREELDIVHGGDRRAFFDSKRRFVPVGPVNFRRRAFATVRVMVLRQTGYKPYDQIAAVFGENEWRIDSFVPGDIEEPKVDRAHPNGILALLWDAAEMAHPASAGRTFARIQTIRAIEVVAMRGLTQAAEPLIQIVGDHPDPAVRQFAAHTLGLLGRHISAPALVEALKDSDPRVRGDAATALSRLGATEALGAIRQLAAAEDSAWTRSQAVSAVGVLEEIAPH